MAIEVFVKCLAKPTQLVSGDAFWYAERDHRVWALVVDGLGHGVQAAEPARLAVACVSSEVERLTEGSLAPDVVLRDVVMQTDTRLRHTRGAALGLALLDAARGEGHFAGVGNVELRICGGGHHLRPVCVPGIVGAGLRRVRVQRFEYTPGQLVVMHSDGLSSRFDLDPSLSPTSPLEPLGDHLISTHSKADDLTLLLVRQHA